MTNLICVHYFVSGQVQGVFYRANTQKKAWDLGLTGWVRNLPDGRVEVTACGERDKLLALQAWLAAGPPEAKVAQVDAEEMPWQAYQRFDIY